MPNWKVPVSSNKELIELAFKQIERETGFHVIDKMYGNSYFFFEDEDDSVCNFRIKEIPGFLFAFWNTCRFDKIEDQLNKDRILWCDSLEISSKSELVFFTQYERDLDKFKPSRSGFVTGIYRNEYIKAPDTNEDIEEFCMYDLIDILCYMKKHPIRSYVYTGCQIDRVWDEISGLRCLYIFIKEACYYRKNRIKAFIKLKHDIRIAKRFVKKIPNFNTMIILRREWWSPRVQINLRRSNNISLEEYEKQVDIIDEYEDKYFNRISFEEWEVYITDKSNKDDIEKDKKYKEKFYKIINGYRQGLFKPDKVIYTNIIDEVEYEDVKEYFNK